MTVIDLLQDKPRVGTFYLGLLVGLVAAAWSSRIHSGNFANVLMPAYAACALVAPIGLARFLERTHASEESCGARAGASPSVFAVVLGLAYQFFVLRYDLSTALPASDAEERAATFLLHLSQQSGDILLPDVQYVQTAIGKPSYGLGAAARDLLRLESPSDRGKLAVLAELSQAFRERRFSAVYLSEEYYLRDLLLPTYCFSFRVDLAPLPVTGWIIRPTWVWVPRGEDDLSRRPVCSRPPK
jgi:hypothetical protein